MLLIDQQLQSFQRDGFLILRDFAHHVNCEAIRDVAEVHLKHKIEPIETEEGYHQKSKDYRTQSKDYQSLKLPSGGTVRRLRQVYHRDILFKEWMEDHKIRPILQQLLQDQVAITLAHHNSIMTKLPHQSTETAWHQDRRYWRYDGDNLLSVWLALGEEHEQNGVLEFIPQSHQMQFEADAFDEKEYFRTDSLKNMSLIETKVSTNLHRGDVVLFHAKLLHRANANRTDTPKISFVYTVKGASIKPTEGTRSAAYGEILLDWLDN